MKTIIILTALALPAFAQDAFDFKLLDKLGVNAKRKTNVSLDARLLKLATGFLDNDSDAVEIKALIANLRGVYVRSWEFDQDGLYNEADLEAFRDYLRQGHWNRIVESREEKEFAEVYLLPLANDRLGGVAVISAEPREVTVVYISGSLKQEDIAKLSGNMGIPDLGRKLGGGKAFRKSGKAQKEKDE